MNTLHIEKTIIVSALESDFICADKRIREHYLDPELFTDSFHKLLVKGINRLKELDMPMDFELLRDKMLQGRNWSIHHDNALIEIMTHRAFGTYDIFMQYYKLLEKNKMNSFDLEVAI